MKKAIHASLCHVGGTINSALQVLVDRLRRPNFPPIRAKPITKRQGHVGGIINSGLNKRVRKMASMSSLSPRGTDIEYSDEDDSMTDDEKEKFEKREKQRNQDEDNPPKKKRKRRLAGDRSGRQLALRRIKMEEKKDLWENFLPLNPSFTEAAKAS